jgi:hypothetical protein
VKKVLKWDHHQVSTYGIGKEHSPGRMDSDWPRVGAPGLRPAVT